MLDTPKILNAKVYAVVAKSYAGRGCEVYEIDFSAVERPIRPSGIPQFSVKFFRRKPCGLLEEDF